MPSVIRGEPLPTPAAFSFQRLEDQARALVDQAERRAADLLAAAEARARALGERVFAEARREGFAQGRCEGAAQVQKQTTAQALSEAREKLEHLSQALQSALEHYEASKRRAFALAESGMIRLALALAARICKRLAQSDSDVAIANVRQALELARHAGDIELHLHPDDLESVRAATPELAACAAGAASVRFVADADVGRGGCRLESRDCRIDATLETQLERAAAALLGESE